MKFQSSLFLFQVTYLFETQVYVKENTDALVTQTVISKIQIILKKLLDSFVSHGVFTLTNAIKCDIFFIFRNICGLCKINNISVFCKSKIQP